MNANATSPSVRITGRGRLAASCNPDNFYLLTVTFRQIVQADDVVFGRVELDLGLGLKGHVGVGFWISFLRWLDVVGCVRKATDIVSSWAAVGNVDH